MVSTKKTISQRPLNRTKQFPLRVATTEPLGSAQKTAEPMVVFAVVLVSSEFKKKRTLQAGSYIRIKKKKIRTAARSTRTGWPALPRSAPGAADVRTAFGTSRVDTHARLSSPPPRQPRIDYFDYFDLEN